MTNINEQKRFIKSFRIKKSDICDVRVLEPLESSIDKENTLLARRALLEGAESVRDIVIDLRNVQYLDSFGASTLFWFAIHWKHRGGNVVFCEATGFVLDNLSFLGISQVGEFCDSLFESIARFQNYRPELTSAECY